MVVSVSSGRTLKAAVDQFGQLDRPQHRLVSMVGAIAQDGSSNRYDVALHISEKTGGKHFLLPAPLIADSEAERAQWCQSPALSHRRIADARKPTCRSSASATSGRSVRCMWTASSRPARLAS